MMVENFGSYLKHERELRGVSLEEISGATKIHIRFLKALEENSFDELPGEVFVKGYIRSYANIIGSDIEETLNIYKETVELKNQETGSSPIPSFSHQYKIFIVVAFLVVVFGSLAFGISLLLKKTDELEETKASLVDKQVEAKITRPSPSIDSDISEEVVEEIIELKQKDSTEPKTTMLSVGVSNSTPEDSEKNPLVSQTTAKLNLENLRPKRDELDIQNPKDMVKPLSLTIMTKEHSWFNMTIDDFKEEDFILSAGSAKTFRGNTSFRLTVGNKTGVELSLNGQALTLPASKDRVVKDFIINSKLVE
jgi:cytoskeleton protein RodZ